MERWLSKEIELSRRHEELIMRREALLRGTEAYFDIQDARSSSFITNINKAEQRNNLLLKDMRECLVELKEDITNPGSPKFTTLKNNYWTMVRNVLPVWYEELQEYERRHGIKPFSAVPTPRSEMQAAYKQKPASWSNELHPAYQHKSSPASSKKAAGADGESADEATLISVPPLDLDFSQTDEVTVSHSTVTVGKNSGKRVHYDEESLRNTTRSKSVPPPEASTGLVPGRRSQSEDCPSLTGKKASRVKKSKKDSKAKSKKKIN